MNVKTLLKKVLQQWASISRLYFILLDKDGNFILSSEEDAMELPGDLTDFLNTEEEIRISKISSYHKIYYHEELVYLLAVFGTGLEQSKIGELAVCQILSLLETTLGKLDKNSYMQNLLSANYTPAEAARHAARLHLSFTTPRAIFLIETKQASDEHALAAIRNMLPARTGNFITSVSAQNIILVKDLKSTDTYEDLEQTAQLLVTLLNTEVMTQAWAAYGCIADNLSDLPNAYKEATTALEVGKIFYPAQNTFGYRQLGIGHLIYQLPPAICEMFTEEVFKGETLDSLDEETLRIIHIFFENNLNLSETARQLYMHRNTLVYRFEKLQKRFGLDIRTFEDAMTFKIAMMVVEYVKFKEQAVQGSPRDGE